MPSTLLCVLLGAGCSSSEGGSNNGGTTGGGGVGATSGAGGTNGGGAGGAGTAGTPVGGVGGTGVGGGGAGAGAGGIGGSTCDPSAGTGGGTPTLSCDQFAGSCGDCIWEKCCELAEMCSVDTDCACMATCIATASLAGTTSCLGTCGLAGSPPGFADLAICLATACANFGSGGECSVPSGFQPPPDIAPAPPTSSAGIGSGALADCSFGAPDPLGSVLQLQNADGSVCVRIERRNDGPGSLANTNWTLLNMLVGPLGQVVFIDNPADLCWYSSHHNFNDWAHAWSGSRHYEVKTYLIGHGATPTYTLHVFEQGPLAAGRCSPSSDGVCPIATMDLFPAP